MGLGENIKTNKGLPVGRTRRFTNQGWPEGSWKIEGHGNRGRTEKNGDEGLRKWKK